MRVAIVGVTGMVGRKILNVLEEVNFPISQLIPVASDRSVGKTLHWKGQEYTIYSMEKAINMKPQIALFSAGGSTSLEWALKFVEAGCYVIDNSSAFRMEKEIPLVVPEINSNVITQETKLIANPNCSTIQLVMVLNPLHLKYRLKRLVISTYQSFTGTGMKAVHQYETERDGKDSLEHRVYAHPIFENCIPQCDVFIDNDYTKEEMKMVNETRKILNDDQIKITATAVRVPVHGGHSESVNVEFYNQVEINDIKKVLNNTKGVLLMDNPKQSIYPTPLQAKEKNEVLVGRIRIDESQANTINLWICADNLRKGAATNAVQIAQYIVNQHYI
ncbi:MAG TPA: aspartate-semialdehyde dehydrogenase [Saprospiraceae bacterium]|nr:aspartate-semialdehyde dehydrogenase [Saprospiraceae bacterium]